MLLRPGPVFRRSGSHRKENHPGLPPTWLRREGSLDVVTREIADATDWWAANGGVVAMMVVDMEPVGKASGSLGI